MASISKSAHESRKYGFDFPAERKRVMHAAQMDESRNGETTPCDVRVTLAAERKPVFLEHGMPSCQI